MIWWMYSCWLGRLINNNVKLEHHRWVFCQTTLWAQHTHLFHTPLIFSYVEVFGLFCPNQPPFFFPVETELPRFQPYFLSHILGGDIQNGEPHWGVTEAEYPPAWADPDDEQQNGWKLAARSQRESDEHLSDWRRQISRPSAWDTSVKRDFHFLFKRSLANKISITTLVIK